MSSMEKVRNLATFILKSTIHDEDKYQIGLSKIFFRAGMLAQFEQKRSDRLNALTTLVQKNLRRHVHQKRYQRMRTDTVKVQSWWRMISAQKQVANLRRETIATQLQVAARGWLARQNFKNTTAAIVKVQSMVRGRTIRATFVSQKTAFAATRLQTLLRGALARREYANSRKGVIHLQSCYRRRLAKKELIARKSEAKSVTHFKEVSYKLENKVVELTQNLQKRVREGKDLQSKCKALEGQVKIWQGKHEEIDARSRALQAEVDKPSVPISEFEAIVAEKKEADEKYGQAVKRIADCESQIDQLSDEVKRQAEELEARDEAIMGQNKTSEEDMAAMASLRSEISALREQLNRANALNTLQKNSNRIENAAPPVFNMSTGKENGYSGAAPNKRRPRRHSETGPWSDDPARRDPEEEEMFAAKRSAANANRHVSVAFGGDGQLQGMQRGGYGDDFEDDDPSEEIMKILQNEEQLDEDVLNGLIRFLKVPAPSLQNPPSPKEVLFPAHLISLVTNEMWKYGMVRDSERFLANVMQTVQQHVMNFQNDDAITPGIFWLSNVHEILSFVCIAESDMLQGIGPGVDGAAQPFEWGDYERLVTMVKHDLDSLEYNIYHTWMQEAKKRLHRMVIPALVESQSLPGFVTSDSGGRLFNRIIGASTPQFSMDDILGVLNKVWKSLKSYYVEPSVTGQVITELLKLIGVTSFNDLLMRRNFCSWKRGEFLLRRV